MTQLYARVFVKILQSSLADDWHARHVFEDFLKLASKDGVVDVTRQAFCRVTNTPKDIFDKALVALESPDPQSKDEAHEGRRLLRMDSHRDWGWVIVNWDKYEAIRSREDEREVERTRKRNLRSAKSLPPAPPTPASSPEPTPDTESESERPGNVPDMSRTSPGQCTTGSASSVIPPASTVASNEQPSLALPLPCPVGASEQPAEGGDSGSRSEARQKARETAKEILAHLNQLAGRSFEPVEAHLSHIMARLEETNGDLQGIKTMIERQCAAWKADEIMAPYLRPATLFNRTKFRTYYDDRNQPVPTRSNGQHAPARPHRNDFISTPEGRSQWQKQADARIAEIMAPRESRV